MIDDVAFQATVDGTEQRYVLIIPESIRDKPDVDAMIALHGHGSDRWQFVKDGRDECRASRDVAIRRNMLFVSPDYRAKTSWMGPKAEADLVQLIGDLRSQRRVKRVFLCGGSMGGTAALTFAALHHDLISGVASMNGTANLLEYPNFQDAIQASFGGTKQAIPDEYKRRSAEYWPERFTMPIGLTTGEKDTLVPPQSAIRLAAILKILGREVLLIHQAEGGHSTNYTDATTILEFMLDRANQSKPN